MIEDYIKKRFGDDSLKVFRTIGAKENVSEFKIAEDLRMNINYVRNLLYKFYSNHLVYATRKKDRQKGWYIYYWTFNFKHARDLLITNKQKSVKKLKDGRDGDVEDIYECPNSCIKFKIHDALEHSFRCPECESILVKKENKDDANKINEEIQKLDQELEMLNKPVDIQLIKEETKKKEKKPKKRVLEKKLGKKFVKKLKGKKERKFKIKKKKLYKESYKGFKKFKKSDKYIKKRKNLSIIKKQTHKKIKIKGKPDKKYHDQKNPNQKDNKKGFLQKLKRLRF